MQRHVTFIHTSIGIADIGKYLKIKSLLKARATYNYIQHALTHIDTQTHRHTHTSTCTPYNLDVTWNIGIMEMCMNEMQVLHKIDLRSARE